MRTCDACGRQGLSVVADLGQVPILCGAVLDSADQARSSPTGPVVLGACSGCGYVRNLAFDPELVVYDDRFDYDLHHSGVARAGTGKLASDLANRHDLAGRHVVDVRCGQGELLRDVCSVAGATGTGYDPTYRGADGGDGVRFHRAAADPPLSECDLVLCRHWLEHVADPADYLRQLAKGSTGRPLTAYIEVPNAEYDLAGNGWEIIYPHASYFNAAALHRLATRTGWRVLAQWTPLAGQLIAVEITTDPAAVAVPVPGHRPHLATVADFAARQAAVRDRWRSRVDELVAAGARPAVWGAGARTVRFLHAADPAGGLTVVDLNPRKWGRYLPVTGHRIDPPDRLPTVQPGVVLVTNPAYATEIAAALDQLGVDASIDEAG